jgi:hypothetical protein
MIDSRACFSFQPGMPSKLRYQNTVAALVIFSLVGGYYAGTAAKGHWTFFSWHPLLMTCGMVGLAGIGAMTKKMGGYNNTKVRNSRPHRGMVYDIAISFVKRRLRAGI